MLEVTVIFTLIIYLLLNKINIYNHKISLIVPWLLIIIFSFIELSEFHMPIDSYVIIVITSFLFSYTIGTYFYNKKAKPLISNENIYYSISRKRFSIFLYIFYFLTILNISLAGFIPLINLLLHGDSGYFRFGISGLYGFYLAYANALGVLSYYLFIKTNKKKYFYITLSIFIIFILFVTRQNIISLLVEIFIVRSFLRGFISLKKIFTLVLIVLISFSAFGELRSGDIKVLISANEEYLWVPAFVFWLYGYFYFSGLNLSNLIMNTSAPYFDGSSFMSLIPNFIKNLIGYSAQSEYFLQKSNFTVSTALTPIYKDMGMYEVVILGFLFGFITSYVYKNMIISNMNFIYISIYSTLFFCTLFSFFINFWFYLPIIFQIPFFIYFYKTIFKKRRISNDKTINNNPNI